MHNPLHHIDFYKADHRRQYPAGTALVYSNLTPRKSRLPGVDHVVWFGLRYFVEEYLLNQWRPDFFQQPKHVVLDSYKRRMDRGLGPNDIGTDHIAALHDYGRLPLHIRALPEGTLVPMRVPCMTMWNSHPDFFWITNYLETVLSAVLWGPCTSATIAHEYRKLLDAWCARTGGDPDFVPWQGHDFSMRGMFGMESACLSAAGHLLSFTGTDNVAALDFLDMYYNGQGADVLGGSVPATEHSVMCMGTADGEFETFRRLVTEVYPKGVVSIVSDTWDLWAVLTDYLPRLKDVIRAREGKVVIRPDSGDPVDILCGMDGYTPEDWSGGLVPQRKGVIELLWDTFGGTVNEKGYKVLDPHIGAIYGDSITLERANAICERLAAKGFASTNVVFGIGSYTYQYNTRDTFGFAVKATYGEVNGEPREIFKQPKTDDGTKHSARGLLAVERTGHWLHLKERVTWEQAKSDAMEDVLVDGHMVPHGNGINSIRYRLSSQRRVIAQTTAP